MSRYADIKPGSLKHMILQTLVSTDYLTAGQIVEYVKAGGTRIKADAVHHMHLRPMMTAGLVSGVQTTWGDSVDMYEWTYTLTLDGRLELRELDDELAGKPKEGLVPPRKTPISKENYAGDELKRLPGLPDDRYAAFDLPSVALGWREWPKHLREQKPRERVEL